MKLFSVLQALTFYSFHSDNGIVKQYFKDHNIVKSSNKKCLVDKKGAFKPLGEIHEASLEVQDQIISDFPEVDLPLKCCFRLLFDGIVYTTTQSNTKNCDFCVKTTEVGEKYGLIEMFAFNNNSVYVIIKKVTKLICPFFDPKYPELKSKIFLANLTKRKFTSRIEKLSKAFLIDVGDNRMYISTFSISHLFM